MGLFLTDNEADKEHLKNMSKGLKKLANHIDLAVEKLCAPPGTHADSELAVDRKKIIDDVDALGEYMDRLADGSYEGN